MIPRHRLLMLHHARANSTQFIPTLSHWMLLNPRRDTLGSATTLSTHEKLLALGCRWGVVSTESHALSSSP